MPPFFWFSGGACFGALLVTAWYLRSIHNEQERKIDFKGSEKLLDAVRAEAEASPRSATLELASIDNALARRPALANFMNRYSKIEHACYMAGRAQEAEASLSSHVAHVEAFLKEMFAVMVDPLDQPPMTVSELCVVLLATAKDHRQAMYELLAPAAPLSATAQPTAKEKP